MNRSMFALLTAVALSLTPSSFAAAQSPPCERVDVMATTTPVPEENDQIMHDVERQKAAMRPPIDVVLIGDSLTHRWPAASAAATFHASHPLNLGVEGDQTQNVLWRLSQYPLAKISPKIVTLLIGTNNLGHLNSACGIAAGTQKIVATLRQNWPEAKILIFGITRRNGSNYPREGDRKAINRAYRKIAGEYKAAYIDTDDALDCKNNPACDYFLPDLVHLKASTYDVIAPFVVKQMN